MKVLNQVQFQILDAIYFVESFDMILEEVDETEFVVADELKQMIDKGWIQVMEYSQDKGDFVKTIFYDSDDMRAYSYLATKKGLLIHNQK